MNEFKLRILHISDLHERGPRERSGWRRRRVLGDAWKKNLDTIRQEGEIQLVCFTGDAADWGQDTEYERATDFFNATLEWLNLDPDHLFLVPGNHDIDRLVQQSTWKAMRKYLPTLHPQDVSRWLSGEAAPRGVKAAHADLIFERQLAYRAWLTQLNREELAPSNSPHGRLGYRRTIKLGHWPFNLHIIGLDSAWLAGDDNDSGKLRLTEDQVMILSSDRGEPLDGYRLAMMHHPLEEMADGAECRRHLAEHVDLLLRGHLHESEPQTWADPERTLRQLAAGCLYEGQREDRYPNSCHIIEIRLDSHGRPLSYDVWFRGWAERGHWFNDDRLYPSSQNGRISWFCSPQSPKLISSNNLAAEYPPEVTEQSRFVTDTLYSTLLPVIRMPRYIYSVPYKLGDAAERQAQKSIALPHGSSEMCPFIIRGGELHCFQNLRNPNGPFHLLVGTQKVTRWECSDWWEHEDRSRWFAQLLNRCLNKLTGRLGLNLDREHKRYYFEPKEPGTPLEVTYRPLNKGRSTRKVVWQPISRKTGQPRPYWNHLAVGLQFHRVSPESWCLSIRPEMRITKDGYQPISSKKIGAKVTGKKSRLYNYDLLEEINFWRDYLSSSQPRIVFEFGKGQHIVVGTTMLSAPVKWPGIPEEFAKKFKNVGYEDDDVTQAIINRLDSEYAEEEWDEDEESDWGDEELDSLEEED